MYRVHENTYRWPVYDAAVHVPPDEVHVFAVLLDVVDMQEHALKLMLSAGERQRAERLKLDRSRRQFIVTRAALRTLLGRALSIPAPDVELIVDTRGKPQLGSAHAGSKLRFNVAHSGDLGLIALAADCDVGIDVEAVREIAHLEPIARRYFHPAESAAIEQLPHSERASAFLRCWTGKEAVTKAVGMGLAESLSQFCVPVDYQDGIWISMPPQNSLQSERLWLQPLIMDDDYVAAVATLGDERRARCFTICW